MYVRETTDRSPRLRATGRPAPRHCSPDIFLARGTTQAALPYRPGLGSPGISPAPRDGPGRSRAPWAVRASTSVTLPNSDSKLMHRSRRASHRAPLTRRHSCVSTLPAPPARHPCIWATSTGKPRTCPPPLPAARWSAGLVASPWSSPACALQLLGTPTWFALMFSLNTGVLLLVDRGAMSKNILWSVWEVGCIGRDKEAWENNFNVTIQGVLWPILVLPVVLPVVANRYAKSQKQTAARSSSFLGGMTLLGLGIAWIIILNFCPSGIDSTIDGDNLCTCGVGHGTTFTTYPFLFAFYLFTMAIFGVQVSRNPRSWPYPAMPCLIPRQHVAESAPVVNEQAGRWGSLLTGSSLLAGSSLLENQVDPLTTSTADQRIRCDQDEVQSTV